jgi:RNA recognition motif. (a.k.a. RRM, RBD, or RNP domain)
MGEAACKMTLEAIGAIVDFECTVSEDFPILTGMVEFQDIEAAKQAVKQYNGMNMGMGTALELESV